MDFFLSSTILLPASGYGEWHLARGASVSWSRTQESRQSQDNWLCSSLRLCNLGRPATRSPDKVVRLFVLRVSETSCGKSDKLDESRHRIWLLSSCNILR